MKRGLAGQGTRGIRLRKDQEEKLAYLRSIDPELDISTALRIGLDMFIERRMAQIGPQVYRSITTSLAPGAPETYTSEPIGNARKIARPMARKK